MAKKKTPQPNQEIYIPKAIYFFEIRTLQELVRIYPTPFFTKITFKHLKL